MVRWPDADVPPTRIAHPRTTESDGACKRHREQGHAEGTCRRGNRRAEHGGLDTGVAPTPAAAAPDGVIVLPPKLQIDAKTALKPSRGTAGTALTQNSVDGAGGSKAVTLRYFAGGAKVSGTRPITVEASDDPTFKTIPIIELLRPGLLRR